MLRLSLFAMSAICSLGSLTCMAMGYYQGGICVLFGAFAVMALAFVLAAREPFEVEAELGQAEQG